MHSRGIHTENSQEQRIMFTGLAVVFVVASEIPVVLFNNHKAPRKINSNTCLKVTATHSTCHFPPQKNSHMSQKIMDVRLETEEIHGCISRYHTGIEGSLKIGILMRIIFQKYPLNISGQAFGGACVLLRVPKLSLAPPNSIQWLRILTNNNYPCNIFPQWLWSTAS